jgi:hypothetical protein
MTRRRLQYNYTCKGHLSALLPSHLQNSIQSINQQGALLCPSHTFNTRSIACSTPLNKMEALSVYIIVTANHPLLHHAIFVCTNLEDWSGYLYQVRSRVDGGSSMYHDHHEFHDPPRYSNFEEGWLIGWLNSEDFEEGLIRRIANAVDAPGFQRLGSEEVVMQSVEGSQSNGTTHSNGTTRLNSNGPPPHGTASRHANERTDTDRVVHVQQDSKQWTVEVVKRLKAEAILAPSARFWSWTGCPAPPYLRRLLLHPSQSPNSDLPETSNETVASNVFTTSDKSQAE